MYHEWIDKNVTMNKNYEQKNDKNVIMNMSLNNKNLLNKWIFERLEKGRVCNLVGRYYFVEGYRKTYTILTII